MVGIPQGMKDQELRAIRATHRDDPPAERALVGLAFSGGGIRSATFGLGVLQALKEVDLLGRIHYLSTVSGGGYIGAWFSANCRRARQRGDWPWSSPKADWDASIRHLRRYSNYLSPDVGFFSADTWSMFTVWLRNAMLVQWTVVMAVACVLLVPRLLIPLFAHWYDYGDWRWIGVHCFVLAMIGVAGNQQWVSRDAPPWLMQASSWRYGVGLSVLRPGLRVRVPRAGRVRSLPPAGRSGARPDHGRPAGGDRLCHAAGRGACLCAGPRHGRRPDADQLPAEPGAGLDRVPAAAVRAVSSARCCGAEINRGDLAGYATYGEFLVHGWWRWPFPLSVVFVFVVAAVVVLRAAGARREGRCSPRRWRRSSAVPVLHALLSRDHAAAARLGAIRTRSLHAFVVGAAAGAVRVLAHDGHADRDDGPPIDRGRSRVVEPARRVARASTAPRG